MPPTHRTKGPSGTPPFTARFVDPMLLLRTESLPSGTQWIYELKSTAMCST